MATPQLPPDNRAQKWANVEDVPEMAFQNAAFAVRSMHETGKPTPMTLDDLEAVLVALRAYVPAIGTYLDGR